MATALDSFYPFIGQTLTNAQWQQYLLLFSTDGVRQTLNSTSALAVVQRGAGANKSVDVSAGRILLQGNFGENSTTKNLTIADNASGNPRIDLVVVRITSATPTIQLDILQGTPAGVPVAPTLTQTAATYEVALAQIAVANGFASILTANITDKRAWAGAQATRLASTASAAALPYPSFTSAAPIVIIPVSGTTQIFSIPAAPAGSILVLDFASAGCVVTAGATLRLARGFNSAPAAAVASCLVLQSDGTNWLEIGRSGEQVTAHTYLGNNTGSTTTPSFVAIAAADLPTYTTWTLTAITQNAVNLTFTTTYARIAQFGKTVNVLGLWGITQVGTAANIISITVPAALASTAIMTGVSCLGQFTYVRVSGPIWTGSIEINTATNWLFLPGGGLGQLGVSPSFATANGDILSINATYELA